ncbi:MAG: hypothetical protein JWM53_3023 [bacterium]|nr:hypothetical protein [bacterium]
MTSAEQYQYERGRLEQYRATLRQRMRCAPTDAARKQILDEGDALTARLEQLADEVRGEAARNAASPAAERRYDTAICSVRCVVFPSALWSLAPPAEAEHVGELHRIEGKWTLANSPRERAAVAEDAELLARRLTRNALIETPGDIKAEMDATLNVIKTLNADIEGSRAADEKFKVAWRAFVDEYQRFYNDHLKWTDRFWYSTYERTVEYRQRALDWRRVFEARGGVASSPVDRPPAHSDQIEWKKMLLGVGVGAGVIAGASLLFGRR